MPSQVITSVENNFTKGLVTEFTGLNFPENAATSTENCDYTIVGDVTRRDGFDYEANFALNAINRTNLAINDYKWNNVGGDGLTQLIVQQTGSTLYFYKSSSATIAAPLSTQILVSTVSISNFAAAGVVYDPTVECQFSDGNGYLFVYHPTCDPFFCSYTAGVLTATLISLQIRDFNGITEPTVPVNTRPLGLSNEHLYNLTNQGWTLGSPWQASSTTGVVIATGSVAFVVQPGLSVALGDFVNIVTATVAFPAGQPLAAGTLLMSGSVTGYFGTTLVVNVVSANPAPLGGPGAVWNTWVINPINHGYINTWNASVGNFPSNADVWWYFKDTTNAFNPAITSSQVSLATGNAPQGHYILSAFNQQRSLTSAISGLTPITTTVRPKTGTWFQGRVWYAGVDAQQVATGDASYYTWTENIYFSQIVVQSTDFGSCYQTNDPTSENLFDLLPTDGGVIQIQGCGSIYKLFPIQNGLLVFAANGIWFITGSQGIGFAANDYTITKISSIQAISGTSFVNVNGLPYFWNEEGIYAVEPSQQGGLTVNPLTVGTILSFYNNIPLQSKKFVRGDYHPIDYVVQWCFKANNETSVTDRYQFDSMLNFNTYNKAFFPYTMPTVTGTPYIHSVNYVAGPGGSTSPDPVFKYLTSVVSGMTYNFTFSEEEDDVNFVDFKTNDGVGTNYESFFVTGYKLHGQGQRRFQIPYIYMYSRTNGLPVAYKIQGLWDYANTGNSGRWSVAQLTNISEPDFDVVYRRHKIRGQGLVLQIKLKSVDGQPFDIIGWSTFESQNTGV